MLRVLPTFAFTVVLVASAGSAAQDTKKEKKGALSGVWTREAGGFDLKFDFSGKDSFKLTVYKGTDGIVATCKATVKDGVVKAEITKVDEAGNFPMKPPVGLAFGFKWAAKGDTAELSDLTGDNLDNAKPLVEGEYKKAAEKKKKD